MSKEQVAKLWDQYKNFAQINEEWNSNVNELKPLMVEYDSKQKISIDLNGQNEAIKRQLNDDQEQLQKISDELTSEKSILEFFSQTLGEYNEYNPNQASSSVSATGTHTETDNGITARTDGITN